MEGLEAADDLNDDFPNVFFLHELLIVLALADALEDISVIGELHHDAAQGVTVDV